MKKFCILMACILVTWAAAVTSSGAPSAPAAVSECSALVYNMMDCVGYLMVGGTETTPQGSCCSGLKTLVYLNADCVCIALNLAANLGIDIDFSRAVALPSQCGVASPSFTTCNVSHSPDGSPATTPLLAPSAALRPGAPAAATLDAWSAPAPAPSWSSSLVPHMAMLFVIGFSLLASLY